MSQDLCDERTGTSKSQGKSYLCRKNYTGKDPNAEKALVTDRRAVTGPF